MDPETWGHVSKARRGADTASPDCENFGEVRKRHDPVFESSFGKPLETIPEEVHWSEKSREGCWLSRLGKEEWRGAFGLPPKTWDEQMGLIEESRRKSEEKQKAGGAQREEREWYDAWEH